MLEFINFGPEFTPTRNPKTQLDRSLLDPHYMDRRFAEPTKARTIFLAPGLETVERFGEATVEGLDYVYSNRLQEWYGHDAAKAARELAQAEIGNNTSALYFQAYLRNVMSTPSIELGHILSGINVATQYSYRVFGFSKPAESADNTSPESD